MDEDIMNAIDQQSITDYLDRQELLEFLREQTSTIPESGKICSFTFPVPEFDPLACLEIISEADEFNFYWEKPDQELALSAGGELLKIQKEGSKRFEKMAERAEHINMQSSSFSLIPHSLSGIHFLGGFSFFDRVESSWWKPFGSAAFTIPRWMLIRDGKLGLLTLTMRVGKNDTQSDILEEIEQQLNRFKQVFDLDEQLPERETGRLRSNHQNRRTVPPDEQWLRIVEEAQELINEQNFAKIVLAREEIHHTDQPIVATKVLNTLRNQYPSCYNFLIRNKEGATFIGCSPERLVSFKKNYLLTESLAGSISRGKTATEDVHLEKYLLNSTKNRNEHQFVTNAIEESLQPFTNKIERAENPDVKKLKNVQHLFTPVRAWLNDNANLFDILQQLHPTPAVGGHPRQQAVPYIKKLEQFDRGWYAGPVGWFNLDGGGEFAVAIRSSLIDGNTARTFAGCGIVADSNPIAEWEETNLKLMPILSALEQNEVRKSE